MEKLIYVLERKPELDQMQFADRLLDEIAPRMQASGSVRDITINIADLDAEMDTPRTASPRIYGEWGKVNGVVHFWLNSLDERGRYEEMLSEVSRQADGYLVTESIVQGFKSTWAGRQRRPGVTQMALGRKPANVTDSHFYHHWQDIHSAWSFELHPYRWSYVRNAVARGLTANAPAWRFIVLEHWKNLNEFTDEALYYKSPEHVERCWKDAPEFMDLATYTGGPMSEYRFD